MSLLIDKTIRDFSNLLASSEPAPGGGSTAALSGLMGASLTMMVVNLSVGKKVYEALDESIKNDIHRDFEIVKMLFAELTNLIDEDTKAFNMFMEAMKMPKKTEEDKAKRTEAMHRAGKYALEIPLEVAGKCLLILKHQLVIAEHGNRNAVSDIGVGALMAFSGLEGAVLNVKINLPGIENNTVKGDVLEKVESYLEEGKKLKDEIIKVVSNRIGDIR